MAAKSRGVTTAYGSAIWKVISTLSVEGSAPKQNIDARDRNWVVVKFVGT
jgi:hypothetical protein